MYVATINSKNAARFINLLAPCEPQSLYADPAVGTRHPLIPPVPSRHKTSKMPDVTPIVTA